MLTLFSESPEMIATMQISVASALAEDLGSGDVTAHLIPAQRVAKARVISREVAVICGITWFDEVCRQVDSSIQVDWYVKDGESVTPNMELCQLQGAARSILTAERSALNFLQTLSATATATRQYVELIAHTGCRILDTRKTIPGLRLAQKYAVRCGGGVNHRLGLYDRVLIKENHIVAAGSISAAVQQARNLYPSLKVEVETETLCEFQEARVAGADIIMLDDYDLTMMREAVRLNQAKIPLEVSGGVNKNTVRAIAETGVDFISIGGITKHIRAIDLSLRFDS